MGTDSEDSEVDQIARELAEVDRQIGDVLTEAVEWRLWIPGRVVAVPIDPQVLFLMFVAFHVTLLAVGAGLLLWASGTAVDLGLALVVGSLFSLGAFLAQVWAHGQERVDRVVGTVFTEPRRQEFERLVARRQELVADAEAASGD
jgi:hypothetical protein